MAVSKAAQEQLPFFPGKSLGKCDLSESKIVLAIREIFTRPRVVDSSDETMKEQ